MSDKQVGLLVLLILLAPIETYTLAMIIPILLIGGFSLAAFAIVVLHVLVFTWRDDSVIESRIPKSFMVIYSMGALGLSLLAIELVYPQLPQWFWLWN